jgi:hypothetical protein
MPPMRDVVLVVLDRIGFDSLDVSMTKSEHGCSQPTACNVTISRRSPENPTGVPLP